MTARNSDTTSGLRLSDVLLLGFWFALCTGLGEVAMRVLQHNGLNQKISLSEHYVWMIPVAVILLFMFVAVVLAVAGSAIRFLREPAFLIGVFTFLVLVGPLLTIGRLHSTALLVLGIGVSAAIARFVAPRTQLFLKIVRRTVPPLVGLTLVVPAVALGTRAWQERSETAQLVDPAAGAPNVIIIILDTVRAENLEIYGYEHATMPNLARFAGEGALFLDAWSTSPWTLPSHGSMFTGRYEHELSTDLLTPLDDTYPTLAEHFRDRGYMTAGFAANLLFTTPESGLTRGFVHYESYPVSASMIAYSSLVTRRAFSFLHGVFGSNQKLVRKHADEVTDSFLSWVANAGDRPFFVFMNYFDAHAPYLPPDSLSGTFGPQRTGKAMHDLSVRGDWTEAELRAEQAEYDGALAYLDGELGRLFREIDSRGLRDNTLIVVSADHGEHFGEHGGLADHGNSLYSELLHVPLIFRFPPRVQPATRAAEAVSLRDLAATLTDMAGQTPAPFPGVSLAPLMRADTIPPSPVLSEVREGIRTPPWLPLAKGPMATVVADGFQYIRNGDGTEELYHLATDPEATRNLAGTARHAQTLRRLRDRLDELRDGRAPHAPIAAGAPPTR